MATLYRKRNTWYLEISLNKQRLTRSLETKDKLVGKKLKSQYEYDLLSELLGHKNVTTTERHYAPLLVSDIKNFYL